MTKCNASEKALWFICPWCGGPSSPSIIFESKTQLVSWNKVVVFDYSLFYSLSIVGPHFGNRCTKVYVRSGVPCGPPIFCQGRTDFVVYEQCLFWGRRNLSSSDTCQTLIFAKISIANPPDQENLVVNLYCLKIWGSMGPSYSSTSTQRHPSILSCCN